MSRLTLILSILFLTILPITALNYDLTYDSSAIQGGVVVVKVVGESTLSSVEARLRLEGKAISHGEGFLLEDMAGSNSVYILFLPISATQSLGNATLEVTLKGSGASEGATGIIEIIPGEFISEEIPLNRDLTKLRSEPDEEKQRQSRILYALLQEYNGDSVFHKGPFIIPVEPLRLTSFYGDRRVFVYNDGKRSNSIHSGIDYSAVPGTVIAACGDGKVVFSDERITTGNTIILEHLPGVYSLYYHMRNRFVQLGEMVGTGQLIGSVGATGLATGAHLHWEIRVNAVPVAPNPLVESALLSPY